MIVRGQASAFLRTRKVYSYALMLACPKTVRTSATWVGHKQNLLNFFRSLKRNKQLFVAKRDNRIHSHGPSRRNRGRRERDEDKAQRKAPYQREIHGDDAK